MAFRVRFGAIGESSNYQCFGPNPTPGLIQVFASLCLEGVGVMNHYDLLGASQRL